MSLKDRSVVHTFKFRIRFHISSKGMITGEEKEFEFQLPNGHSAKLHSINAESFSEATKFVVVSGGYKSDEDAIKNGKQLKESIRFFAVKNRLGLDLGKDKATSFLSSSAKDKMFEASGNTVKVIDDVHGLSTYSEEYPASCFSSSMIGLVNPKTKSFFTDEVANLSSSKIIVNDKIHLSMELVTASYFETTLRSRFLTLVLAAESILELEKRSDAICTNITGLIDSVKSSELDQQEKDSIIGSLKWLKKDSISIGLKKMAVKYLSEKTYNNVSAVSFIKQCYDARSKLVHDGEVNEDKYNIGILAANLEVYMTDLLSEIVGI